MSTYLEISNVSETNKQGACSFLYALNVNIIKKYLVDFNEKLDNNGEAYGKRL